MEPFEAIVRIIHEEKFIGVLSVLSRIVNFPVISHARALVVAFKLKLYSHNIQGPEEAYRLTLNFRSTGIGIRPLQVKEEITELLDVLVGFKPKVVLEIGTASGGTLFSFAMVADPEASIVTIDLPGETYPTWKTILFRSFVRADQEIYCIRSDSHSSSTLSEVRRILDSRKVDFLFIDGDHTYEGVKRDFEMYGPLVKRGGIIALHDIVRHPPETGCEVHRFWEEIRNSFRNVEVVKDWNQGWAGIGILYP